MFSMVNTSAVLRIGFLVIIAILVCSDLKSISAAPAPEPAPQPAPEPAPEPQNMFDNLFGTGSASASSAGIRASHGAKPKSKRRTGNSAALSGRYLDDDDDSGYAAVLGK